MEGTFTFKRISEYDPHFEAGEGRTLGYQALMQMLGKLTKCLINVKRKRVILRTWNDSGGFTGIGVDSWNNHVRQEAL